MHLPNIVATQFACTEWTRETSGGIWKETWIVWTPCLNPWTNGWDSVIEFKIWNKIHECISKLNPNRARSGIAVQSRIQVAVDEVDMGLSSGKSKAWRRIYDFEGLGARAPKSRRKFSCYYSLPNWYNFTVQYTHNPGKKLLDLAVPTKTVRLQTTEVSNGSFMFCRVFVQWLWRPRKRQTDPTRFSNLLKPEDPGKIPYVTLSLSLSLSRTTPEGKGRKKTNKDDVAKCCLCTHCLDPSLWPNYPKTRRRHEGLDCWQPLLAAWQTPFSLSRKQDTGQSAFKEYCCLVSHMARGWTDAPYYCGVIGGKLTICAPPLLAPSPYAYPVPWNSSRACLDERHCWRLHHLTLIIWII